MSVRPLRQRFADSFSPITKPMAPCHAAGVMAIHMTLQKANPTQLFHPGVCVITPAALRILEETDQDPAGLIDRHCRGDWSAMPSLARQANEQALRTGKSILSTYPVPGKGMVWVQTDPAVPVTTVLLPSDY